MSTEQDKVNSGALGTLIALLAMAVLGVAMALTALVRQETTDATITQELTGPYVSLTQAQRQELTKPAAWVDQNQGIVRLPVDRAMTVVAQKLQENPQFATPAPPPKPDGGEEDAGTSRTDDAGVSDTDGGAATEELGANDNETPAVPEPDTPAAPSAPTPQPEAPAPTPKAPTPAPQPKAPTPPAPKQPKPKPPAPPTTGGDNPY